MTLYQVYTFAGERNIVTSKQLTSEPAVKISQHAPGRARSQLRYRRTGLCEEEAGAVFQRIPILRSPDAWLRGLGFPRTPWGLFSQEIGTCSNP